METPLLTIDFKNYVLGESQTTRTPDKGFSPESYGLSLIYEKGTLYFGGSETDRSTNLEGEVICITNDPNFLGNDAFILDDEGKYYTLDGSTLTKRQTDSTNTYALGTSDFLRYKGAAYATAQQEAIYIVGSDLETSIDTTWWSTTRGHGALQLGYRHPLEIVEDTLYLGDKNYIHTWDGTTSVAQAMSLPEGVNITTLRRHPDGQHLIAFCGVTANYSHTRNGGGLIYIIDTVNLEWIREIPTESQVEGSKNVGGIVYVTYGDKCGYFNGDGITWLRDLTSGSVTYSHQITNAEDILIIRDGAYALAYGDLGGGGKVWWRAYRANTTGTALTAVGYKGNYTIIIGYTDTTSSVEKLAEVNLKGTGVAGAFYSNKELAGQNIAVRRIEVDHTQTPASGTNAFSISLLSRVGTSKYASGTITYTDNPQSQTRLDLDAFVDGMQLVLVPSNGAMGFHQIRVYGETIE